MEVVRKSLENCVDEKSLVDDILSYIYNDDIVSCCGECGLVDTHEDDGRCKICCNKDAVIREMNNVMGKYKVSHRSQGRPYHYKKFSYKLSTYFTNMFMKDFILNVFELY